MNAERRKLWDAYMLAQEQQRTAWDWQDQRQLEHERSRARLDTARRDAQKATRRMQSALAAFVEAGVRESSE